MRGNLFIIGGTNTGKTTLAERATQLLGFVRVAGSKWIRERVGNLDKSKPHERTRILTEASQDALAIDPDACIRYIRAHHNVAEGGLVFEGLRNPRDFNNLFDPRRDMVVIIDYPTNPAAGPNFETLGVSVIRETVEWMIETHLLDKSRALTFIIRDISEMDIVSKMVLENLALLKLSNTSDTPCFVHAPITPFTAWLAKEYLYDLNPAYRGQHAPCTVFGVSSYIGHSLTFQVLLNDGSVFSYIPPVALWHRRPSIEEMIAGLPLDELVYHGCLSNEVTFTHYPELAEHPVQAWFKRSQRWLSAVYHGTIDWYTGNIIQHLIFLENGQIAILPSHKLRFGNGHEPLPDYAKLHAEFRLE